MDGTKVVVPILFKHSPSTYEHAGTGFIIAAMGRHALVATAGHVLEAICHRTRKPVARTLFNDGSNDTFPVIAGDEHQITILIKNGTSTIHAEAFRSWGSKKHDVAILIVEVPEGMEASINKQFAINAQGPKLGDEVYVFGYFAGIDTSHELIPPGFEGIFEQWGVSAFTAQVSREKGQVIVDYPEGSGLVRAPCFGVDVPFNSGMSGGVIFQFIENRLVACGLISSDASDSSQDLTGTGGHPIASKLEPLLSMDLSIPGYPALTYVNSFVPETRIDTLYDLVKLGVIEIYQP